MRFAERLPMNLLVQWFVLHWVAQRREQFMNHVVGQEFDIEISVLFLKPTNSFGL